MRLPRLSAARVRCRLWCRWLSLATATSVLVVATGLLSARAGAATAAFVHLSVEQGLSQSTVSTIEQDHFGFLWFGTEEGLNRYDGYNFVTFKHDPRDPRSLPDNIVSALLEDSRHRLWVGTQHGLSWFDWATGTFTSIAAIQDRVADIKETKDGTIWVAALGGGVFLLKPGAKDWTSYQPVANDASSLDSYLIKSLVEDRGRRLWIGTLNAGIERFVPNATYGSFVHYRHDPHNSDSLSLDEVWDMAEDRTGQLWVATYGGGVNVLDSATGKFRHYRHREGDATSLPTDLVTTVFVDGAGQVWIGTDGAGLQRYDPSTDRFMPVTPPPSDPQARTNAVVRTLFEDRQHQLWVGTYLGGVAQMKPAHPEFAYFIHQDGDANSLSDSAIASCAEDDQGRIWLGTEGGWLNQFDREAQTFTHYPFPSPPGSPAAVLALHVDRAGRLWAGSYRGGLGLFDPARGAFSVYRHDANNPASIAGDEVWSIADDGRGALWLATNNGVDRFDPERRTVVEHLHPPAHASYDFTDARAIQCDRAGNLWIGNFGGLTRVPRDGGTPVHYQHVDGNARSLGNNAVVALHLDAQGRLWAGTLGGGLSRWDPAHDDFTTYNGFPSAVVNAIEEDGSGRIWISTNHGLSRLTPSTGEVVTYDLTNGLQSLQFHLGAALRTRHGRLLFGSMDGLYDLDPAAIQPNAFTPPVRLTALRIYNSAAQPPTSLPDLGQFTLRPADQIASIEFAALDYEFPRRTQYAYQLDGLSDRWINLGEKREITFTNLAPATYTLRIRSTDSDGVWHDDSGAALQLTVLPPFWKTWWWRAAALGLFTGGLFTMHRMRVRRLTAQLEERRRAEAALRASEERFSQAFHASPVPMAVVRLGGGEFVDVNDAFTRLVGYVRAELIGRRIGELDMVTPEDRARAAGAIGDPRGIPEMEFHVRTKLGEWRTVLASVAITELGGQRCALGVGADITERERAEAARRESEEQYRRFFDEDLASAFICRADGQLLACNPAFVRMFGYASADEAKNHSLFELCPDRAACEALIAKLRRQHRLQHVEHELRRVDGHNLHVIANVIGTFAADGELVRINGYLIDTTDRKKLEAQLLQSQKMEAVGQLAGGVAHDFNNLLTGIIGYTDLLLMGGRLDAESCGSLQEIRGAASRAAALTRQLLAFSRRQLLQPRVIDLNELVGDMENMLRRLIGEDIDLAIVLAPTLGRIKADRSQVEQVILNLVVNARDAMPRGGRLTIDTANAELNELYAAEHVGVEPGSYVRLAVSDTGCGMDAEVQARIFEPFFTTKAVGKGTGLGLSTVYGIVKQSNGHIALYSEPGAGSTFKIYLPRADAPASGEESGHRARPLPRGTETILLVEDNEVVRRATAQMLRQHGYDVLEASEAIEAIGVFERSLRPVHLLLTDVIMPGLNGRELAERLAVRKPGLRVVFMSGYTDDAISRHGGLSDNIVFLEKPFAPDMLIAKVQEALRRQPAIPAR